MKAPSATTVFIVFFVCLLGEVLLSILIATSVVPVNETVALRLNTVVLVVITVGNIAYLQIQAREERRAIKARYSMRMLCVKCKHEVFAEWEGDGITCARPSCKCKTCHKPQLEGIKA